MEKSKSRRGRGLLIALFVLLSLIVLVPLGFIGASFIGRESPSAAVPPGFSLAFKVPHAGRAAEKLAAHETVGEILADPAFASAAPLVALLRDSSFFGKDALIGMLNNELSGALYPDDSWVVSFDTGILSSVLRVAPFAAARLTIPNLYYVNAGKVSRFEYRDPAGATVFAGFRGNLLVASNSSVVFEGILSRSLPESELGTYEFAKAGFDAALLADPSFISASLPSDDPLFGPLARSLSWEGFPEVLVDIRRDKLDLSVSAPLSSSLASVGALLEKPSSVPLFLSRLPESTQYESLLSAGGMDRLLAVYRELDPRAAETLENAERASRLLFGIGLNELLFDWIGPDVAVFGLEGRPKPVFALQIADEEARKRAFDRLLSSLAVSGDDSTVLDGYRISRMLLPDFLASLLNLFSVRLPSPYWIIDDGFFLASESPETLLAAVSARRRGETLARNDIWQNLTGGESARASVSLFYTLDRSVPFFLKGSGPAQRVLSLYNQGCLSVRWEEGLVSLKLSAVPGSGGGLGVIPGFPLVSDGNGSGRPSLGKKVDVLRFTKKGGMRILCIENGNTLASYDPASGSWERYSPGAAAGLELSFVLDRETACETPSDPAVWVSTSEGEVSLLDGNLKPVQGFPVITGIRPTAKPAAFASFLYLADADSSLRKIDSRGGVSSISMPFSDPLRSPPAVLRDGKNIVMGMYPKSFASRVWLTDGEGAPKPGWPQPVSGLAYGSPLVFASGSHIRLAFITQAGDLFVFEGDGAPVEGFPVRLDGVFYAQPIWDGSFLWAVSADGSLWRVGAEKGKERMVLSQKIPDFKAESASLASADADGDGTPEVFATGDGNTLYGYSASFSLLSGFPLAAWGEPWFGDLNGDGRLDCLAVSMDNTIAGWQFRKER